MKTILILCVSAALLFSCRQNNKNVCFDTIDISCDGGGWRDYSYSAWIDNKGNIIVFHNEEHYYDHYYNNNRFVYSTLTSDIIDSISSLVKDIDFSALDTVYFNNNCADCTNYNIIITQGGKSFKLLVDGFFLYNEQLKYANKFVYYISSLSAALIRKNEDVIFKSKTNRFYIEPPARATL